MINYLYHQHKKDFGKFSDVEDILCQLEQNNLFFPFYVAYFFVYHARI